MDSVPSRVGQAYCGGPDRLRPSQRCGVRLRVGRPLIFGEATESAGIAGTDGVIESLLGGTGRIPGTALQPVRLRSVAVWSLMRAAHECSAGQPRSKPAWHA